MTITHKTIKFEYAPQTINWKVDDLIDWADGGAIYSLDGKIASSNRGYGYSFDSAIQSENGVYAVIYDKLGTKGLLLKNGLRIREINRSMYHADAYEYPIAFVEIEGEYSIIHCPEEYNRIEVENVETGTRLTSIKNREPDDCFHSRFRVNVANTILINAGWIWHPVGVIMIYNLEEALMDNSIFDTSHIDDLINCEVSTAEFLTDDLVVIGSSSEEQFDDELDVNDKSILNPLQLGLFSISKNEFIKKVKVKNIPGTQVPIDENFTLDLFDYPKVIDLNTGEIVQEFKEVNSGKQDLAIVGKVPPMAIDRVNRRVAIVNDNRIEILTIKE